MKTSSTLLDLG